MIEADGPSTVPATALLACILFVGALAFMFGKPTKAGGTGCDAVFVPSEPLDAEVWFAKIVDEDKEWAWTVFCVTSKAGDVVPKEMRMEMATYKFKIYTGGKCFVQRRFVEANEKTGRCEIGFNPAVSNGSLIDIERVKRLEDRVDKLEAK